MYRKCRLVLLSSAGLMFSLSAFCASDPCSAITHANSVTTHSNYTTTAKSTGVALGPFMGKIHMHYTAQTCKHGGADSVNGEAVTMYSQHMVAPEGVTDEQFWVSNQPNRILREEIDGNMTGSGHGHLSMLFHFN